MKYLYLKAQNPDNSKFDRLVPVNAALSITWHDGVPFLTLGDEMLIDVDSANEHGLLPFLADSFGKCDVVTILLTDSAKPPTMKPTVKRGLEL